MQDHIIICGIGNIGFRTFEILSKAGQKIVVISDIVHDELKWKIEAAGGVFYLGDARNDLLLIEAGIKAAKAILAITDQDMVNATIAMDARTLNPNIKIIMRMLDVEIGNHLAKTFDIHQVFSVPELAAPVFARSIVDSTTLAQFVLDGELYLIADKNKASKVHNSTILTGYADLEVVPTSKYKTKTSLCVRIIRRLNYLRSPAFAHFRMFLFILLCVILFSALFLHWAMPLPYADALYFVTTTVTTVGYGDINFLDKSVGLKFFGCLLMLSGAAAIALLFGSIIEIILSKKLPSVLGGMPVPKKNHVLVVGAGHIGHKIVSTLLEENVPIVIIGDDTHERYSADINHQVALVEGYLHSNDTLERARVRNARAILVITDDDVENLSISIAAKKMNPNIINITQIFSSRLSNKLQAALALDRVLSVASIAAPYFAAAVFGDKILAAIKWQQELIFLTQASSADPAIVRQDRLSLDHKVYENILVCSVKLNF